MSKGEDIDFSAIDSKGWYPLNRAVELGNPEILKKLLQKGANPNFYKHDYVSPVNFAIFNEDLEIVTFLIPSERWRGPEGTESTEQSLKESEEIQNHLK